MTEKRKPSPQFDKIKKMKKGVDFPKLECYYKQAVADTTAKNTIRYHVLKIKKLKKLLDKDTTK